MGLGVPEVILILLILTALVIGVLLKYFGGRRRRFSDLENRVERLEQQADKKSEQASRASRIK
jgi:uncharacterized integral membrane protein